MITDKGITRLALLQEKREGGFNLDRVMKHRIEIINWIKQHPRKYKRIMGEPNFPNNRKDLLSPIEKLFGEKKKCSRCHRCRKQLVKKEGVKVYKLEDLNLLFGGK